MTDCDAILARIIERLRLRRSLYTGQKADAFRIAEEIIAEEAKHEPKVDDHD